MSSLAVRLYEGENKNLSGFSKKPALLEGYGSYYPTPLSFEGAQWAIIKEPISSVHKNNIFLVRGVKIDASLPYGSDQREYKDMIFENGILSPLGYKVGANNHADRVSRLGIIDADIGEGWDGYKLYDENFQIKDFPGTPAGYHVARINFDKKRVSIYSNDSKDMNSEEVYLLNDDLSIQAVKGLPQDGKLKEIRDEVVALVSLNDSSLQYFYDNQTKEILPFVFKGMEGKEYTIRFIHPDQGYIQVDHNNETLGYVFNGTTNVLHEQIDTNPAEISGDRYDSQKKLLYKCDKKEIVLIGANNEEIPFSGLAEKESISYEETYKMRDYTDASLIVIVYTDIIPRGQIRRYSKETGEISPIKGQQENRRVSDSLGRSGSFSGVKVKITGYGDSVFCLLNHDGSSFLFYKGLVVTGIIQSKKTLIIATKEGPNAEVKLDNKAWKEFMKEWSTDYVDTKEEIAEALSS